MPDDNTQMTPSIPPVDPTVATAVTDSPSDDQPSAPVESPSESTPTPTPPPVPEEPVSDAVVTPTVPSDEPDAPAAPASDGNHSIQTEVASKIAASKNVLIALSSDPSVDEMAAAIGLSLFLDKLGKRATAIYSGSTPNALEFLKPEETFEPTADTLQDFVIALNKDKADHLRYKLDGDYVKIYITPYKTRLSESDLEYSYGDFNVDLVLALDVANGIDLDSALREHGRIMHDAVIINITTGKPGKFGEIEWSDKTASSISEMIADLLYKIKDAKIEKEEATAFLTGIVAATNRFSNATTTPETMQIASKLMESGANQQLVSQNITPDIDNEMGSVNLSDSGGLGDEAKAKNTDPTKLDIQHGTETPTDESKIVDDTITEKESTLLDDLKAAEAGLAGAGAEVTPEKDHNTLTIENNKEVEPTPEPEEPIAPVAEEPSLETPEEAPEEPVEETSTEEAEAPEVSAEKPVETPIETPVDSPAPEATPSEVPTEPEAPVSPEDESLNQSLNEAAAQFLTEPTPLPDEIEAPSEEEPLKLASEEKVIEPTSDLSTIGTGNPEDNKYGQMLEAALEASGAAPTQNPAVASTPDVPESPEINGVPEMNYMPMPGEEILPPPPAPPIDMSNISAPTPDMSLPPTEPIAPAAPTPEPTPEPLGVQPAMQDQVYAPQATDPGAFKIPGM